MHIIPSSSIASWERFYRANFINCLSGYKPASLIGTVDAERRTNLGLFSNIVHIGADPALIGFINRPREAAPHTIANIESSGFYTINHIHPAMVAQAHQCSAKYAADVSEFDATGLTAQFAEGFAAPFVQESRLKYGLSLQQVMPIALNGTYLVIGKVELVMLEDGMVLHDGFIDLERLETVSSAGLDAYYTGNLADRFAYARPGTMAKSIAGKSNDAD